VKLMRKNISLLLLSIFLLSGNAAFGNHPVTPKKMAWPFSGIFGKVDRRAAQRGFQVFKEVCASCHGLSHLSYRNLKDLGFSEEEIKEIAKTHSVMDGPNDEGEMYERAAVPSDHFPHPFPNEQAARLANNGAYPPDLSLIVKA